MNKIERKFNSNDYQPKRFGLKFTPPQIIMEYLVPSSGKLYHHKIRLNKLNKDSKIEEVMREIYEKHSPYLDGKKVNPNQMKKLIERLKVNLNGANSSNLNSYSSFSGTDKKPEISEKEKNKDTDYYKNYDFENENLNHLNDEDLKRRKNEMDVLYNKNAILPGQEGFEFDVRKDFDFDQYDPEWDDDLDESDDCF